MIFQKVDRELWIITAAKKRLAPSPNTQEAANTFSTASNHPNTANAGTSNPNAPNAGFRFGGLLATWVVQSSLDPARPVVMISISKNHYTCDLIKDSNAFAIHLITSNWLATA